MGKIGPHVFSYGETKFLQKLIFSNPVDHLHEILSIYTYLPYDHFSWKLLIFQFSHLSILTYKIIQLESCYKHIFSEYYGEHEYELGFLKY